MRCLFKIFAALAFFASAVFPHVSFAAEDIPTTSGGAPSPFSSVPQPPVEEQTIKPRLVLPSTQFAPGKSYPILVEITVADGFHINSDKPLDKVPFPTSVKLTSSNPMVTFGRVVYPKPKIKDFPTLNLKLSVWEGTIYVASSISLANETKEPLDIKAHIEYQACTDITCLMPTDFDVDAVLPIGTAGKNLETDLFSKYAPEDENLFDKFKGGVGATGFLLVFLGGLALNLTPCVYPMIPVTVGFFGAAAGQARTRRQRLEHALVYLLGMALMYSSLGVVAALTGSLFGGLMQNTVVVLIMAGLMLLLASSMFGAFEIIIPSALMDLSSKSFAGFFGSFFMGLTVGILAAPCVGPFVIGMLAFVGEKQDPLLGFMLFFTLALGLGLPLTILAVFSGAISSLPRSGVWMEWVRKVFGVIMVGMAVYFLRPLLGSETVFRWVLFAVGIGGGFFLIYAGRGMGGEGFQIIRYGIGIVFLLLGFWLVASTTTAKQELPFKEFSKEELAKALASKPIAMLDFTADWCVPCRELKAFTFSDPRVLKRQNEFSAFTIDLTKVDDKKLGYKKDYGVFGVPTVILLNSGGQEVDRFTGFITADEFLKRLDKLKN
ncbi:MAG: thioredoxin fold domain-containing protein [Nitrospinae bacterium]|nr:thioredoxin fold domain-containing protein [Nitrospinota bacterium]